MSKSMALTFLLSVLISSKTYSRRTLNKGLDTNMAQRIFFSTRGLPNLTLKRWRRRRLRHPSFLNLMTTFSIHKTSKQMSLSKKLSIQFSLPLP